MPSTTTNRVAQHVASIRERVAALEPEAAAKLDAEMAVDFGEHFAYQEAQARAHVSGQLTSDEAMIVYVALGEVGSSANGGWAKDTDTATKVTVTMLMGELIRARLGVR